MARSLKPNPTFREVVVYTIYLGDRPTRVGYYSANSPNGGRTINPLDNYRHKKNARLVENERLRLVPFEAEPRRFDELGQAMRQAYFDAGLNPREMPHKPPLWRNIK